MSGDEFPDYVARSLLTETTARAELAEKRVDALLEQIDRINELGNNMTIGLVRAADERDHALARIADVRRVLHAHAPGGRNSAGYDLWADIDTALDDDPPVGV